MRILQYRHQVTLPLLELVIGQMDAEPDREMENKRMATVILAGFERMATVVTGPHFLAMNQGANNGSDEEIALALIGAEARVLELVIRAQRKES
jgi:hypothetical protein